MRQKRYQYIWLLIFSLMIGLTGCGNSNAEKTTGSGKTEKQEITVATTSESGGLDPAGMIANTYLAYSLSALDNCWCTMRMER